MALTLDLNLSVGRASTGSGTPPFGPGFNIDLRDTHANIIARTGDAVGTIAFATDTYDLYVYDGSNWYFYDYDSTTAFPNQYSVSFDGTNDYVSVTPSSSINLYGLSVWFKCDFVVDKNAVRGVLLAPGGTNWFIGLGGNFTSTLTDELISINTGARYGYCSSTDTISAGWHNVVVAWSTTSATTGGNGYDIYLDGVKVGNQSNTTYGAATLFSLTNPEIRLGERFGMYPFPGLIDEVAIFNSTLSSSDISSIYNSGVPNDISSFSPVAWWRMGDNNSGIGTTITDQGSGGNDGTLTNGPTFSTSVPT